MPSSAEGQESTQNGRDAYIAQCTAFSFSTVARNPGKTVGEKYAVTGKVVQVIGSGGSVELRVNTAKDKYGLWDDAIYATLYIPTGEDRIPEGDIVTLYGECTGGCTYTTVLGSSITLPSLKAKYYIIQD